MPLVKKNSILGTGKEETDDVQWEADVIFTAAFIGMTLFHNAKKKALWRVDMEPNNAGKTRAERTEDDQKSMKLHNDVCSKVTYVVRAYAKEDYVKKEGGVTWGLSPTFDRGGMICAGEGAKGEYAQAETGVRENRLRVPHRPPAGVERRAARAGDVRRAGRLLRSGRR